MKTPQMEERHAVQNSNKPPLLRTLAEQYLDGAGGANLVQLIRDIVGPEPFNSQPLAIRLMVVVCLGFPVAALFWFEWEFSRMIPAWLSLPLTGIALGCYLWKRLHRTGNQGSVHDEPSTSHGTLSSQDDAPDVREARLFARALIVNIKLYNQKLVAQGRLDGSLYLLLKKDIDQARALYDSRVPRSVRETHDYFAEELVRILADGDPHLLKT